MRTLAVLTLILAVPALAQDGPGRTRTADTFDFEFEQGWTLKTKAVGDHKYPLTAVDLVSDPELPGLPPVSS